VSPAALVAVALIGLVVAFQIGLVMGAPWGAAAWGGSHPGRLPGRLRLASLSSIVILAVFGWVVLARDGSVSGSPLSDPVVGVLAWVVAGYFLLGTTANAASRSRPERWWAPVSLGIAVAAAIVAAG